ncbi:MAG: hypothetical protein HZB19_16290 [Chloroflexi bacterium]|nr:hypothetical protein [Chloroflexota bacterium]
MPHDQAYLEAEKKIEEARLEDNHPRIPPTNKRMRADLIRLFVTPFVDGTLETKGGNHGA